MHAVSHDMYDYVYILVIIEYPSTQGPLSPLQLQGVVKEPRHRHGSRSKRASEQTPSVDCVAERKDELEEAPVTSHEPEKF